ncbi:hypothetical protein ISS03_01855 [Patescibacteria group bacterium]|nr:hypothetical protein [Patescibacteria group bacterium]
MLIVTLPAAHQEELMLDIISHPLVDAVRYNIGTCSAFSPKLTLKKILWLTQRYNKKLWIDLKGRQLRIAKWAVPQYGRIFLNHKIKLTCPAKIFFRGGDWSFVKVVRRNEIFVDPLPRHALGEGQAINIAGDDLEIEGNLTEDDREYLQEARALGINNFMLSFVEREEDLLDVWTIHPEAQLVAKIESQKGMIFVENDYRKYTGRVNLMAARDDLYINIGPKEILGALKKIVESDADAIVASRILCSLEQDWVVSLADLADVMLMKQFGYRQFMFSDGLSQRKFKESIAVWGEIERR